MGNGVAEESSSEKRSVTLRDASPEDEAFMYAVYLSTRSEEMAAWGWTQAQQEMFARMQFNVRRQAYRMQFPASEEKVILFGGERAGSLIVESTSGGIRLVDIAVLSEFRNAGIGRAIIEGLFAEADAENKIVRLQVRRENDAARRLYERLGFSITDESELDFSMERLPHP
jgi:ribosomal protein S18 acetylase RimI-like enzyme